MTAKLIDVYPPSSDSIVRARYRELTIEMYPTSLVFRRGHRIRLDVSRRASSCR